MIEGKKGTNRCTHTHTHTHTPGAEKEQEKGLSHISRRSR